MLLENWNNSTAVEVMLWQVVAMLWQCSTRLWQCYRNVVTLSRNVMIRGLTILRILRSNTIAALLQLNETIKWNMNAIVPIFNCWGFWQEEWGNNSFFWRRIKYKLNVYKIALVFAITVKKNIKFIWAKERSIKEIA